MNKVGIIIKREYLTRVKKKSFLIMTLLGPILMASLVIIPILLTGVDDQEKKYIAVFDDSCIFKNKIQENSNYKFDFIEDSYIEEYKKGIGKFHYDAILLIPDNIVTENITLYSESQPSVNMKQYISSQLEKEIRKRKLLTLGVSEKDIADASKGINLRTIKLSDTDGEKVGSSEISLIIGFTLAIVIYMFIFMYGALVMRGVIEEKTGRIVEIIVSSVKPFQLMIGKILGIAMVALTQFILWGIIAGIIILVFFSIYGGGEQSFSNNLSGNQILQTNLSGEVSSSLQMNDTVQALLNTNFGILIGAFVLFFILGYLLYASLFAAIGAAVDNETDSQQFTLPVTIPLILAFMVAKVIVEQPDGQIAFWFSIIPFTSPIIMPVRIALEAVSLWEFILSVVLLAASFFGTVWFAGKIYRVGILMYGKKVSYKEILKWVKHN